MQFGGISMWYRWLLVPRLERHSRSLICLVLARWVWVSSSVGPRMSLLMPWEDCYKFGVALHAVAHLWLSTYNSCRLTVDMRFYLLHQLPTVTICHANIVRGDMMGYNNDIGRNVITSSIWVVIVMYCAGRNWVGWWQIVYQTLTWSCCSLPFSALLTLRHCVHTDSLDARSLLTEWIYSFIILTLNRPVFCHTG